MRALLRSRLPLKVMLAGLVPLMLTVSPQDRLVMLQV
jgi:preprotein translocase subunit SecY